MAEMQEDIIQRLATLRVIPGVEITTNENFRIVDVKYRTVFSLDFQFKWDNDHYIGYPLNSDRERSHAVVSLWSAAEASRFAMAYTLLIELRANR